MAFSISKRVRKVSKRSRRRTLIGESLESRAMLTTFYVSGFPGAPVPGDGSIDSPFATISEGVAAAMKNSEADEIVVASRVTGAPYDETVTFLDKGSDRSAITIRGATGDRADVRLTAGNGPSILADAPIELTIKDLTIDRPQVAGVRVIDGDVTVENVRVANSLTNSGIVHQQGNLIVRDSLLENNYQGLWSAELRDNYNNQIGLPGNITVENTISRNNNAQGVYTRNSTGTVILRDLDASNNRLNGIVVFNDHSVHIDGGTLSSNGQSGAAIVESEGVSIAETEFSNNGDSGVWVRATDSLNVSGGQFADNGIRGLFFIDSSAPLISGVVVTGNSEGGIRIDGADGATIDQAVVTGNGSVDSTTYVGGGGIHIEPSTAAAIAISNTRVSDNETRGNGGGIEIWANNGINREFLSNVTISNTAVTGNQIAPDVYQHGGGIALFGPIDASIENVVVSGNTARGTAGLHAYTPFSSANGFGSLNISNSTVADNVALREGPGIGAGAAGIYHGGGEFTLSGSTISGNDGGNAGGIYLSSFGGEITNSTISGNNGHRTGGLVSYVGRTPLTLRNVTIVDNYGGDVGGLTSNTSQLMIGNSVVANNTSGNVVGGPNTIPSRNMAGVITSLGGNFFAEATFAQILGGGQDQVGTLSAPLDPLLGPLQDNGGPTLTHAPLPDSPLVDAGDNAVSDSLMVDQRGQARIQGDAVDVGAVEQTVYVVDAEAQKSRINLNSADKGNKSVTLVLHATDDVDATLIDATTIVWASTTATKSSLKDVDHDGDLDLVLEFNLSETDLVDRYRDALATDPSNNSQTVAVPLTGRTLVGDRISGSAEIDLLMTGKALRDLLASI